MHIVGRGVFRGHQGDCPRGPISRFIARRLRNAFSARKKCIRHALQDILEIIDLYRPGFLLVQPVRRTHETISGIREAYGDLYDSSAECLAPGDVRFPVRVG